MNALAVRPDERLEFAPGQEIAPGWKWRERTGAFVSPSRMETRHLFYTLRMIWNNRMPAHMSVGKVRLYSFRSFYTRDYFAQAIIALGRELMGREDIAPVWRAELEQMRAWLGRSDLKAVEA